MKIFLVTAVVAFGVAGMVHAIETSPEQSSVECLVQEQGVGAQDEYMVRTMADQIGYFALGPKHESQSDAKSRAEEQASLETVTDSQTCGAPKNNS